MAKINLILVDGDTSYIQMLTSYILGNYNEKFNITCLTDKEILVEELKAINKKDLLVINKEFYDREIEKLEVKTIIILGDGREEKDLFDHKVINKYQHGGTLCKSFLDIYGEQNKKAKEKIKIYDSSTKILTFYSPVGGSGKSILAAATAMVLAANSYPVLYLNLEDVQSTRAFFSGDNQYGLSDLIYGIKEREENLADIIISSSTVDKKTNVRFFDITESILDIEDLTVEDVKWFMESLLKLNAFSHIIIDTSSKYNSVYNILINSSSNIISPMLREGISLNKMKNYVENIANLSKHIFIYNKVYENYNLPVIKELNGMGVSPYISIENKEEIKTLTGNEILNSKEIYNAVLTLINTM